MHFTESQGLSHNKLQREGGGGSPLINGQLGRGGEEKGG